MRIVKIRQFWVKLRGIWKSRKMTKNDSNFKNYVDSVKSLILGHFW